MPNYLIIDVETTGATNGTKGSAFTPANRLCVIGAAITSADGEIATDVWPIEYTEGVNYGHHLRTLQQKIDEADLVVTFTKFDLHWLRRYGVQFKHRPYYDLQCAEFILNGQRSLGVGFDSVNALLDSYGLESKLDVIKTEYWNKGIDTDQVPYDEVLVPYTAWDCTQEARILHKQLARIRERPSLRRIIFNTCQDEVITQEMEWNGIKYDVDLSLRIAHDMGGETVKIDQQLYELFPYSFLNWDSPEQVSAVLFGGTVSYEVAEPFLFSYKNPKKAPVWKTKKVTKTQMFPRLVTPPDAAKLAKEGQYSTGDKVLAKLKATGPAKQLISLILQRRGIEKKIGTWYKGFPEKIQEFQWPENILHTNLSHATAKTGRLASTNPNVQNIEDKVRECLVTRFPLSSCRAQTQKQSTIAGSML